MSQYSILQVNRKRKNLSTLRALHLESQAGTEEEAVVMASIEEEVVDEGGVKSSVGPLSPTNNIKACNAHLQEIHAYEGSVLV